MNPLPRHPQAPALPPLILDSGQLALLMGAVRLAAQHSPEIADVLADEIDRADVRPSEQVPASVIRIGSWVTYQDLDHGSIRTIQLVSPGDAHPAQQKYSVLSPIGAALIGLSVGQTMPWSLSDGEPRRLTVLRTSMSPGA